MALTEYANETNGLGENAREFHREVTDNLQGTVDWTDPRLDKIIRLRLLTDPGFPYWDISYCYGQLKDGTYVRVQVPFYQLPRRGMLATIVEHAKKDGVNARRLMDNWNAISKLW